MTKNSVCLTPYLRNRTSYDCDFWYTILDISPANFFIFQKYDILGFLGGGGKKAKNDGLKLPISVCFAYISGTVDHIIVILILISTGVFLYFFKRNATL